MKPKSLFLKNRERRMDAGRGVSVRYSLLSVLVLMALLILSACHGKTSLTTVEEEGSEYTIQELVKQLEPKSIDVQDNGDVLISYEYGEEVYPLKDLEKASGDVRYGVLEKLNTTADSTLQNFMKVCKANQTNVVFHYVGLKTKDVFDIKIPYNELD